MKNFAVCEKSSNFVAENLILTKVIKEIMAKIIKRKHDPKSDDICEFWFDNEAWVCINFIDEMYEYQSNPNDGETYFSGCLEFEDKVLVGYDGCYELPDEVIEAVKDLGHEIEEYITLK